MTRILNLYQKWMKNPKYRKAFKQLEEEFAPASSLIDLRNRAGMTQAQLAKKMGTAQPVVARFESGKVKPSMRTLGRLAEATGSRLRISFVPNEASKLRELTR